MQSPREMEVIPHLRLQDVFQEEEEKHPAWLRPQLPVN